MPNLKIVLCEFKLVGITVKMLELIEIRKELSLRSTFRHLFYYGKLTTKAIDISNTRKKKSRRVRAANNFLSNFSLDGKVSTEKNKKNFVKSRAKLLPDLDEEELHLITNLSNESVVKTSLPGRPKLLASFSASDATEDSRNLGLSSCVSSAFITPYSPLLVEHPSHLIRATSFKEPKRLSENIVFACGGQLCKFKGNICGKRVVLCSRRRIPFAVYSTLKYCQQYKNELLDRGTHRLRRLSGGDHDHGSHGIQGIDIGSKNKPVSYGHLLVPSCAAYQSPRNVLHGRRTAGLSPSPTLLETRGASNVPSPAAHGVNASCKVFLPREHFLGSSYGERNNYDPLLLDDPELRSGRHRKVLRLCSYMVSIIEYVKPSQLKKGSNKQFKEKFRSLEITLSKLRSLKHDLAKLSNEVWQMKSLTSKTGLTIKECATQPIENYLPEGDATIRRRDNTKTENERTRSNTQDRIPDERL